MTNRFRHNAIIISVAKSHAPPHEAIIEFAYPLSCHPRAFKAYPRQAFASDGRTVQIPPAARTPG